MKRYNCSIKQIDCYFTHSLPSNATSDYIEIAAGTTASQIIFHQTILFFDFIQITLKLIDIILQIFLIAENIFIDLI
jgi:hypothetical protein